ncbi:hypothetical protein QNH46_01235 [Paenibacillus woosongensis]|uniref:Uncharacterized protein n=1 Tax=Paenibacillus woosongensis TaxID=307580 RepID=A0AA95L1V7_9BACL|nr:hypothetical protein [Paenibacillus woosongensis]WHX49346.1 hypothetical protein QNH46_01235 [Paenibacillus woosongensis]
MDIPNNNNIVGNKVSNAQKGGKRPGAGRKPIGLTRKISLTLPPAYGRKSTGAATTLIIPFRKY